jgi:hypothetical protein
MAEKPTVFISYPSSNLEFARQLRTALAAQGYGVWMDRYNLPGSTHWQKSVRDAIQSCDQMVVVMSDETVQSDWVQYEVTTASQLNKPIIPVLVTDQEPTSLLNFGAINVLHVSPGVLENPDYVTQVVRNFLSIPSDSLAYPWSVPLIWQGDEDSMDVKHPTPASSYAVHQVRMVRELAQLRLESLLWGLIASAVAVLLIISLVHTVPAFGETNMGRIAALILGLAAFATIAYFYMARRDQVEAETRRQVYEQNKAFFDQLEEELDTLVRQKV